MKPKVYKVDYQMPDSDRVYTQERLVLDKSVIRREVESLGGIVVNIK